MRQEDENLTPARSPAHCSASIHSRTTRTSSTNTNAHGQDNGLTSSSNSSSLLCSNHHHSPARVSALRECAADGTRAALLLPRARTRTLLSVLFVLCLCCCIASCSIVFLYVP